jgi:tRNA nucleotidyltransferase/poly(A) polymerase
MKLKHILQEAERDKLALEFLSNLVKKGPFKGKVYLAGGAPRDMQLGADPKDLDVVVKGDVNAGIDFATWATKELGNFKEGSNPVVYPTYGTAKFTFKGITYKGHDLSDIDVEAVAPRKEKYTPGNRKPEVSGGELEDDVKRRDFTVNSLLHDLSTGETLDLTGMGKEDIKAGIVRTPLDPDVIFGEDPLRILRAARFTAKYNWKLPMFMLRSIKKNAHQLTNISKERIHDELNKMLLTDFPFKAFRLLQILGLMKYTFPSLEGQNLEHMKPIPELPKHLQLRLIATLKNVPPTKVQSEMSSLRYNLDNIKTVVMVIDRLPAFLKKANNLTDDDLRRYHLEIPDYIQLLFNYAAVYDKNFNVYEAEDRYFALSQEMKDNPIPVTGADLIAMGLKPGPDFKKYLDAVKELYIRFPKTPKDGYLKMIKDNLRYKL